MAVVGIEIASGALRAVRFSRYRPGQAPQQAVEVPFTPDGDRLPAAALRELLSRVELAGATVALAIPSSWCFYRSVAFPYRNAARVESTLRYSLEGRLPGPVESYTIEALGNAQPAGAQGSCVCVAACPNDRLKALLAELKTAGLDPAVVQPALVAMAMALPEAATAAGTLVVRAGTPTEMAVVTEESLAAAQVAASPAQVAQAWRAYELSDGAARFDRVLLLGDETLRETLERDLGRPVALPAPGAPEARWLVACGAASQAHEGMMTVNLREGEFAAPVELRRRDFRLTAALLLLAGLAGVVCAGAAKSVITQRDALKALDARRTELFAEVTGRRSGTPTLAQMESAVKAARGISQVGDGMRVASGLQRWVEFMKLVPENSGLRFEAIDITQRRMVVTARVRDHASGEQLKRNIQASPLFTLGTSNFVARSEGTERFYVLDMQLEYRK